MNYIVSIYGDPVQIIADLRGFGIPLANIITVTSFTTGSESHTGHNVIFECSEEQFEQLKIKDKKTSNYNHKSF